MTRTLPEAVVAELTARSRASATGTLSVTGDPGGLLRLDAGRVAGVESPGAPGVEALLLRSGRVLEASWVAAYQAGASHGRFAVELVRRGLVGAAELEAVCLMALYDACFAIAAGTVDTCYWEPAAPAPTGHPAPAPGRLDAALPGQVGSADHPAGAGLPGRSGHSALPGDMASLGRAASVDHPAASGLPGPSGGPGLLGEAASGLAGPSGREELPGAVASVGQAESADHGLPVPSGRATQGGAGLAGSWGEGPGSAAREAWTWEVARVGVEQLWAETGRRLAALGELAAPVRPGRDRLAAVADPAAAAPGGGSWGSGAWGATASWGGSGLRAASGLRREVLGLADGRRTARDIAFTLGRGVYPVTVEASRLLADGLLRVGAPSQEGGEVRALLAPRHAAPGAPGAATSTALAGPVQLPRRPSRASGS